MQLRGRPVCTSRLGTAKLHNLRNDLPLFYSFWWSHPHPRWPICQNPRPPGEADSLWRTAAEWITALRGGRKCATDRVERLQLWDNLANRPQNDKLPGERSRIEEEVERTRGQRASDHAFALRFMIYYPLIGRSEIIVTLLKLLNDGVERCQHLVLPARVDNYLLFCFCDEWNDQRPSKILFRTAVDDSSGHFGFDCLADPLGRDTPAAPSAISDLNKYVLLSTVAPHLLNITQTQIPFHLSSLNPAFLYCELIMFPW